MVKYNYYLNQYELMIDKNKTGKLFVVSASSGAGKTTLVTEVINRLKNTYNVYRAITYTTKKPRPGEKDGIDYHFIDESDFKQKIGQDFFVEYSTVYGAYYGFPRSILSEMAMGVSFFAIVDIEGAKSLKTYVEQSILIWIKPTDLQKLEKRLKDRAQDSAETIAFRLSIAKQEEQEDVNSLFDAIIINDDLEMAIEELQNFVKMNLV